MESSWTRKRRRREQPSEPQALDSAGHNSNPVMGTTGSPLPLFLEQISQPKPSNPALTNKHPREAASSHLSSDAHHKLPLFLNRSLTDYPHGRAIRHALGCDIPGRAVLDPESAAQRDVPAYTEGTTSHFASPTPPLEVAAHEAAHILQHAGRSRDASLGAEGHANAISRAVLTGSGAGLITQSGASVPSATRAYTVIEPQDQGPEEWDTGQALRVSDDGFMATAHPPFHDAWAAPFLIEVANNRLQEAGSAIRLQTGSDMISGPAPNSGIRCELARVIPENTTTGSAGELMHVWADCGRAAREVMGVEASRHSEVVASYTEQVTPMWWFVLHGAILSEILPRGHSLRGPTTAEERLTEEAAPSRMRAEIFRETLGESAGVAWRRYLNMSSEEREDFDRRTGINEYAQPNIGEAYVGHSGFAAPGERIWNFHWAGVIMTSGHDRMTLENFTVGDRQAQNTNWQLSMYGPASAPGQTFHEQLAEGLGPERVTMEAMPRPR